MQKVSGLQASQNLKHEIRLFLRSYVGYLEGAEINDLYISLIEKSRNLTELEGNVERAILEAEKARMERFAETLKSLHENIKNNYFRESTFKE
ncbi:MAG: hypothetical protein ACUVTM_05740 [Candidatus Bathyarchaeia archaeon]